MSAAALIRKGLEPAVWPLVASGLSAALLAGAFAFEVFGNYPPCPMCVTQRWIHAGVVAAGLAALGLARLGPSGGLAAAAGPAATGALFLGSALYAGRHAAVEYGLIASGCSASGVNAPDDLDSLLSGLERAQNVVLCDEAAWSFLGVSMAGYNALISLAAAGAAAYVTLKALRKTRP